MAPKSSIVLLLTCHIVCHSASAFFSQSFMIMGRVICNTGVSEPGAINEFVGSRARVEVWESDNVWDDRLSKTVADEDGKFVLNATNSELWTLKPYLKVYHPCNSYGDLEERCVFEHTQSIPFKDDGDYLYELVVIESKKAPIKCR